MAQYGFRGVALIEKPVFDQPVEMPKQNFSHIAVGYNLRRHPLLRRLKSFLDDAENILTAHIYAGADLPQWRPDTNYRKSCFAKRKEGGGVLRDLSHELDYVTLFAGRCKRVAAIGGKVSGLLIESDDVFSLMLEVERCSSITA